LKKIRVEKAPETGLIFDIKRFALHDGPGIRTTVFLKGCPLACAWCHNPEGIAPGREVMVWETRCIRCGRCVEACPEGAIPAEGAPIPDAARCRLCGACADVCPAGARELVGREMTVAEVMAAIEKDVIFYDESGGGATFSGGEPLLQADFLAALLAECKAREIHTALDTTGFAAPEILDKIAPNVDLFLYDLKIVDAEKHRAYTGVSNTLILSNLRRLVEQGCAIIIRVPIIPGVNDGDGDAEALADFIASLGRAPQVDILPYHRAGSEKYARLGRAYRLPDTLPPTNGRMAAIEAILRERGWHVTIGGQSE
jgi:pyruvate formate lyase activating enzyme